MRLRNKLIFLAIIVLWSYPLSGTIYTYIGIKYWGHTFHFYDQWRRIIGYTILGYFFGWATLLFAIMDEVIQIITLGKDGKIWDIIINVLSVIGGIGLTRAMKITFMNPFKKKQLP